MIVRAAPRPLDSRGRRASTGRPQRPITVRERAWVTARWGVYTARWMARYIRGGKSRLYQIARALGLPALPKGPRP